MNPLLRKLSGPRRSLIDLADVLEQHIGDGADEGRCKEALEALRSVRRDHSSYYVRMATRVLEDDAAPREKVRKVIAVLRKWRFHSGV